MPDKPPMSFDEYDVYIRKCSMKWKKLRDRWTCVAALFGIILGVVGILTRVLTLEDSLGTIVEASLIAIVGFIALMVALVLYLQSIRNRMYAEIISSLHCIVHILRNELMNLQADSEGYSENRDGIGDTSLTSDQMEKVKNKGRLVIQRTLDCLREAFKIILREECRVTLKMVETEMGFEDREKKDEIVDASANGVVKTFVRDSHTSSFMTDGLQEPGQFVLRNERFNVFVEKPLNRFMIVNDVEDRTNPMSASDSPQKYQGVRPYCAEMIWPVRWLRVDLDKPKNDLVAFLIVDCMKKNVFNNDYHFHLGALVADSLYMFIDKISLLRSNPKPLQILDSNKRK